MGAPPEYYSYFQVAQRLNTQPWQLASVSYSPIWLHWATEIMYCEAQAAKTRNKMNKPKSGRSRR